MLQRRSISVPVDGGELSVEVTGPVPAGGSPVVLLLHDLASNGIVWRLVTARIDETVSTFAIDARGRVGERRPARTVRAGQPTSETPSPSSITSRSVVSRRRSWHGGLHRHRLATPLPDRVDGVVLVDGGLPITVTSRSRTPRSTASLLPVLQRLRTTHADRDAAVLDARQRTRSDDRASPTRSSSSRCSTTSVGSHRWCGVGPTRPPSGSTAASCSSIPTRRRRSTHVDVPVEMLRVAGQPERADGAAIVLADADQLERRLAAAERRDRARARSRRARDATPREPTP